MSTRLALLADVHGNADALRAVLADLDERGGADRLLVLGDIVLLGPDPGEVVELLMARDSIGVYGNIDQHLLGTDWHTVEPQNEQDKADRTVSL
jgi:predicted phosphodiesterase